MGGIASCTGIFKIGSELFLVRVLSVPLRLGLYKLALVCFVFSFFSMIKK